MKRFSVGAFAAALALSGSASAASFDSTPPTTNPSGTASFPFKFRSNGPPENGAVAYKVPGGIWKRCIVPNVVSLDLGPLADGTYTMAIADDINIGYWANLGLLYSGHTAPCSTTDEPTTIVSTYSFTVAPAPVTVVQAPGPTPEPPEAPAPAITVPVPPVADAPAPDCSALRRRYRRAEASEVVAKRSYKRRGSAVHRRALLKAQRETKVARKQYYANCD